MDYTISLTNPQEAALTDVVAEVNIARANNVPPLPAITKAQHLQNYVSSHARELVRDNARKVIDSVTTWSTMTANQKSRFCAAVGLNPCPP